MLTGYTIDSDFGVFEADGNAMFMRRGNQRDREAAEFETVLFRFLYLKTGPAPYPFAAWQCTRLVSAKIAAPGFLARNELVASVFA